MKVGKKKRRNRKRNPVPHGNHGRHGGAIKDPISRSMAVQQRLRRAEALGKR